MEARIVNGKIIIVGADNPWRLAARLRKYAGVPARVSNDGRVVVVPGIDRDTIDRLIAAE